MLNYAREIEKNIIEWRRHLHQNPELSHKEYETTKFIINQLKTFSNVEILTPCETGVVAVVKGAKKGKTIGLRADIDALPINELADISFRSKNEGVMHGCGHDIHTAILLGAVKVISRFQKDLSGEVYFIFQRSEEISPSGAKELVESGILNSIDCFYAIHVLTGIKSGVISIKKGYSFSHRSFFDIHIQGKGGHSSQPHENVDPIIIAGEIITALQTIVSRNISPLDTAVVSLCSVHSGVGKSGTPHTADLEGVIRSFEPDVREIIIKNIIQNSEFIAKSKGGNAFVKIYPDELRAVNNDESLFRIAKEAIKENMGGEYFEEAEYPLMASEDFSEYEDIAPTCIVWLGVDNEDEENYTIHNPYFNPNESAFINGVLFYVSIIKKMMCPEK